MTDHDAFDRQLAREIDHLAGPEPRVDVEEIVVGAARPAARARVSWLTGSFRFATASAVIAVFGLVLAIGWMGAGDRDGVVGPGSSPSPALSPVPGSSVTVSGTWSGPEPDGCETTEEPEEEPWLLAVSRCGGLRLEADDPRLTVDGSIAHQEWADGGQSSEAWSLANMTGTWESRRYHAHERLVLLGGEGYEGMTAVLTLSDDGTFSGFIQAKAQADDTDA